MPRYARQAGSSRRRSRPCASPQTISFIVGTPDPADQALIDATDRALQLGIKAAHSGAKLGDIGAAVGNFARSEGYGILADRGGHGVGRAMREEPHVPSAHTIAITDDGPLILTAP